MPKRDPNTMPSVTLSHHESPVGVLHIAMLDTAVCSVLFDNESYEPVLAGMLDRYVRVYAVSENPDRHAPVHRELDRYFEGRLKRFTCKLHTLGTDFQLQVWTALRTIPYGTTTTYKAMAQLIGNASATRAVGGAIGRNPISIIIPCHRVIGENGALTGFGGGIERKKQLLRLEGSLLM